MPYDCRAIANAILNEADAIGLRLTHMALHKIAYYAHGWQLAYETGDIRDPRGNTVAAGRQQTSHDHKPK